MKFYLCAQKEGEKCYVSLTFDTARNLLNAGFKMEKGYEHFVGGVVGCLGLKSVFGEFIERAATG